MPTKIEVFNSIQLKKGLPDIKSGDTIRVYQKIKEGDKERIQVFEGLVIARKHGKGINSTITVRKVISGIGVERIFPLHSPLIEKMDILKRAKTRRAKLYFLREARGKRSKLKNKVFAEAIAEKTPEEAATAPEEIIENKEAEQK